MSDLIADPAPKRRGRPPGRRKGNVTRVDPRAERELAKLQRQLAAARREQERLLEERNRLFYMLFHAHGYTQEALADVANRYVDPKDPSFSTEDTVQKALARMARTFQ